MSDKDLEQNIISTFEKAFAYMTKNQKEKLLCYGEGMAAVLEMEKDEVTTEDK